MSTSQREKCRCFESDNDVICSCLGRQCQLKGVHLGWVDVETYSVSEIATDLSEMISLAFASVGSSPALPPIPVSSATWKVHKHDRRMKRGRD